MTCASMFVIVVVCINRLLCYVCVSEEVRHLSSRWLRPGPGAFPHLAAQQTPHQRCLSVPTIHPALPTLNTHMHSVCVSGPCPWAINHVTTSNVKQFNTLSCSHLLSELIPGQKPPNCVSQLPSHLFPLETWNRPSLPLLMLNGWLVNK